MANNDLLVSSSLQNIRPKVESNKQDAVKQPSVDLVSKTAIEENDSQEVKPSGQKEDSLEALQEKVSQLNEHMQSLNRSLQFSIDETSGDTVVKVIDAETKELVRQIPSQDVIDARNAVAEYRGILLETKV